MIRYFFRFIGRKQNPQLQEVDYYRLYAIIDEQYYWTTEWYFSDQIKMNVVQTINGGFVTEEITELCKNMSAIDFEILRNKLGAFAYFIERAVNGFKSYIIWISPDPHINDVPWQVMNN
ncbi:MAG TPA: hypothetical protein VL651_14670 [Bacteroidia bacterium]|jgi:hypothetical protein|nr:hypothetical protein [Bacteroidia bacterium]